MARKRVKTKNRIDPVVDWKIKALATGEMPKPKDVDALEMFHWIHSSQKKQRADWLKYRDMILPGYIAKYPGKRPWAWWCFDAPRWQKPFPGCFFDGKLPEPRLQVGGTGSVIQEKYPAILQRFSFGVPGDWFEIDEDDPPVFESQAAYLKRHGLLTDSERKRISDKDFEPESVLDIIDFSNEET